MTDDEIEKKARAEYEAARDPADIHVLWEDLPEYRRETWRALIRGDAGVAQD